MYGFFSISTSLHTNASVEGPRALRVLGMGREEGTLLHSSALCELVLRAHLMLAMIRGTMKTSL